MGSVHSYETKAGRKLYRISYRRPDHSQTTERGFTTKKSAELRLAEVEVSKAKGDYVNPSDALVTTATLAKTWLTGRKTVMKPSAFRVIDMAWRVHVEPKWGARSVGGIRASEVQGWVSELAGVKSATTTLRAYGVLASLLDVAVKDRRVSRNVARGVDLPRKPKAAKTYLSHGQVQQLADASKYPTLVLFLAYTGLRWGEATGLRVKHVDALRRRVMVAENAVRVGGPIKVGTPKTHELRSVPYPPFLALPIAKLCEGKNPDMLLFGDGIDHMKQPNADHGWFVAAVRKVQDDERRKLEDEFAKAKARGTVKEGEKPGEPSFPRVTPHDLRHTAASLAISAGANVKAVQRMLGHASAAMTLDTYADLFDDDLDAVSVALDKARSAASVVKVLSAGV